MAPLFIQILKIRTPLILGGRKLCTYSDGTDRSGEPVMIFLYQMTLLRWLTFLLGSQTDSHSHALLDLFIS